MSSYFLRILSAKPIFEINIFGFVFCYVLKGEINICSNAKNVNLCTYFQVCWGSVHGVLQPDIPLGEPAASPHRIHAPYSLDRKPQWAFKTGQKMSKTYTKFTKNLQIKIMYFDVWWSDRISPIFMTFYVHICIFLWKGSKFKLKKIAKMFITGEKDDFIGRRRLTIDKK